MKNDIQEHYDSIQIKKAMQDLHITKASELKEYNCVTLANKLRTGYNKLMIIRKLNDLGYLPSAENTIVTQFTENRDGVGIDRFSGGASDGAKFELQVVRAGVSFETEVYLRNFEVWQLGGLMLILQDLEDGLIRIGSGRSRGLGSVKGAVTQVDIQYLQPAIQAKPTNEIWGLGKFLNGENQQYGTSPNDLLNVAVSPSIDIRGIRLIQRFNGNSFDDLKKNAMNAFVQKIQQW